LNYRLCCRKRQEASDGCNGIGKLFDFEQSRPEANDPRVEMIKFPANQVGTPVAK